jgi:lipopolysaccharide transport system permease protein
LLLPLAAVIPGLLDLVVGFIILIPVLLYYGFAFRISLLLLPAFVVLAMLAALAVGFWFSALNARYRDVRYAAPFIIQLWLFVSPVAYPSTIVPTRFQWLYGLNPMAAAIEGFRWSVTGTALPSIAMLLTAAGVTITTMVTGLIYFHRSEATIADVV